MQACKWVIGATPYLDRAHAAWAAAFPQEMIEKITLAQNARHQFDLTPLNQLDPTQGSIFVAFDERFGNFKRAELMQAVMERGFKLGSFVSPRASVADNVKIGINTFIGDGATVGYGSRIDFNNVLLAGAHIGNDVHIRPSCWVEPGVIIGNEALIGMHCTVRSGALVAPTVQVGRYCELGWPQRYSKNIAAKTYFDSRYSEPIHTYEN